MSSAESTENKFDLSTKLLGGSFLGLGIGLIGLVTGLSSGEKEPFIGWLWGCAFWLSIAIGMLIHAVVYHFLHELSPHHYTRWTWGLPPPGSPPGSPPGL